MLAMPNSHSRSVEDYLEAIFLLSRDEATVRTKEIAKALSVSPASVSEMMRKLADRGLVEYQPYNPPKLTKKGRIIGQRIAKRSHSQSR